MNIEESLSSIVKKNENRKLLRRAITASNRQPEHSVKWVQLYLEENGKKKVHIEECVRLLGEDKLWCSFRMYSHARDEEEELMKFLHNPIVIEKGVTACIKCKGEHVLSHQIQTRSNDETATTVNTCADCGANWRYSG